jgi:hypothetical protein
VASALIKGAFCLFILTALFLAVACLAARARSRPDHAALCDLGVPVARLRISVKLSAPQSPQAVAALPGIARSHLLRRRGPTPNSGVPCAFPSRLPSAGVPG